jgi:translation initiation factor IF-2
MAELKLPRLLGAAKEFNVGQETLIDFLIGKGFPKDELKPTSKLTEDMYRALQNEFQQDKAAKMKSDQVDLPKGALAEAKKKKEEEEIVFKKDDKKIVKKEEAPAPPPPPPPPPVVEEKPKVEEPKKEEEIVKVEAPEIEKPKVLDKIDLSAIDSSTRPKKAIKKKEEPKVEAVEAKAKPEVKEIKKKTEEPVKEVAPVVAEKTEDDAPPVIENIEVEKLTGPKILGKIDLPVENDTRPKNDEKRARKRIPIAKKDNKTSPIPDKDKRQGWWRTFCSAMYCRRWSAGRRRIQPWWCKQGTQAGGGGGRFTPTRRGDKTSKRN